MLNNVIIGKCCARMELYQVYNILNKHIEIYMNDIFSKELFGAKDVQCTYDRTNDIIYLQYVLDKYLEDLVNNENATLYGENTKSKDEILSKYCFTNMYDYFLKRNTDILPILEIYGVEVL